MSRLRINKTTLVIGSDYVLILRNCPLEEPNAGCFELRLTAGQYVGSADIYLAGPAQRPMTETSLPSIDEPEKKNHANLTSRLEVYVL